LLAGGLKTYNFTRSIETDFDTVKPFVFYQADGASCLFLNEFILETSKTSLGSLFHMSVTSVKKLIMPEAFHIFLDILSFSILYSAKSDETFFFSASALQF